MDPTQNEYEEDTPFAARIENNTDLSKLRLSDAIEFPRTPTAPQFRSDEQHRYRVVIARAPQAGWIWVVMPLCFIGLFAFACAGVAIDLRRRQPPPTGLQQNLSADGRDLPSAVREQEIEEGESSGATRSTWTSS
jgi:hypothetical protein